MKIVHTVSGYLDFAENKKDAGALTGYIMRSISHSLPGAKVSLEAKDINSPADAQLSEHIQLRFEFDPSEDDSVEDIVSTVTSMLKALYGNLRIAEKNDMHDSGYTLTHAQIHIEHKDYSKDLVLEPQTGRIDVFSRSNEFSIETVAESIPQEKNDEAE